jgi:hypothetical protein
VTRHCYFFEESDSEVVRAVAEMASLAECGELYIIVDEVGHEYRYRMRCD